MQGITSVKSPASAGKNAVKSHDRVAYVYDEAKGTYEIVLTSSTGEPLKQVGVAGTVPIGTVARDTFHGAVSDDGIKFTFPDGSVYLRTGYVTNKGFDPTKLPSFLDLYTQNPVLQATPTLLPWDNNGGKTVSNGMLVCELYLPNNNSDYVIRASTDCVNWTTSPFALPYARRVLNNRIAAYNDMFFISCADNNFYVSYDGLTWDKVGAIQSGGYVNDGIVDPELLLTKIGFYKGMILFYNESFTRAYECAPTPLGLVFSEHAFNFGNPPEYIRDLTLVNSSYAGEAVVARRVIKNGNGETAPVMLAVYGIRKGLPDFINDTPALVSLTNYEMPVSSSPEFLPLNLVEEGRYLEKVTGEWGPSSFIERELKALVPDGEYMTDLDIRSFFDTGGNDAEQFILYDAGTSIRYWLTKYGALICRTGSQETVCTRLSTPNLLQEAAYIVNAAVDNGLLTIVTVLPQSVYPYYSWLGMETILLNPVSPVTGYVGIVPGFDEPAQSVGREPVFSALRIA